MLQLFEASLLGLAESIFLLELKVICYFCSRKGSVKVDFRVIIVFVATDPKNESTIVDKKATTGQRIIKEAQKGLVSRLRVKPQVIVKSKLQTIATLILLVT